MIGSDRPVKKGAFYHVFWDCRGGYFVYKLKHGSLTVMEGQKAENGLPAGKEPASAELAKIA